MYGTTRCPYCTSRAKITEEQLDAYSGMVRCGHCRKTFDARADFVLELPSLQLELPMPDMPSPPQALPVLQPMTLAE
ncbi:MAG: hypothetical protein OEV15_06495, partial [Gallionella sp.]|nr:hypothetical protein [Gallionella sp.]